ncbi:MAG: hypothetical protein B7Y39_16030 [Bdellovibrio sp. 28-41-41]|nr:MAG: hypothetical protein B7Y39_16030 [Bdellovibrio sp. 28-41-41]
MLKKAMDKLILLNPGFQDPEYPNRDFYCWHCVLLEGLISIYPFEHFQRANLISRKICVEIYFI